MAKPGLVFVPVWGVSHFVPFLELGKRLLQATGNAFSVTVLVVNPPASPNSYVQSLASSGLDIAFREIPPPQPPILVRGPEDFSALFAHGRDAIKDAVTRVHAAAPVAAVVLDLFGTSLIDVTDELGLPSYVYFASTAVMLALMLHLPLLHEKIPVEFMEMEGDVEVPGILPIPPRCMPRPLMNKKGRGYNCFLDNGRRFSEAKGIIVNTFEELEPGPLKAVREGRCGPAGNVPTPPIYAVGPLIAVQSNDAEIGSDDCIKWLDSHPPASVAFLCFGSMRGLDAPIVREMATGLERSGQRFLWSLRVPPTSDASLEQLLPEGFLERTKDKGLVWPAWASQKDILAHPAVGAFVTHCGWNSICESLWFGVPMVGWPLYAEQHLNALEMAREVRVAVELKADATKPGNFVAAEEFERGLRALLEGGSEEGRKVRAKVEEMKVACRKALEEEEEGSEGGGGSSCANLVALAQEFRRGSGSPRE